MNSKQLVWYCSQDKSFFYKHECIETGGWFLFWFQCEFVRHFLEKIRCTSEYLQTLTLVYLVSSVLLFFKGMMNIFNLCQRNDLQAAFPMFSSTQLFWKCVSISQQVSKSFFCKVTIENINPKQMDELMQKQ